MINQQLAEISNLAIVISIVLYVLALIGFAADLASNSQRRSDSRLTARDRTDAVKVGSPIGHSSAHSIDASDSAHDQVNGDEDSAQTLSPRAFAFLLSCAAAILHTTGVTLRAVATQRVPWANMYEFATTSAALVMVLFLAFSIARHELRSLGTFVVGAVLLVMLLAQTFWIVPAAALTPSLQNTHWLIIHIGVAILATALSILGALVAGLQLLRAKHEKGLAAKGADKLEHPEHRRSVGHLLDRTPVSKTMEALSFRIHSIAFVSWTFTLMFGAIWAREAWGRYWGWDPKEVWTFIIWVIYAAYLHAHATGGFRGTRAAWLALAGFLAVVFNYTIVNTVINGLHSYSGI